MRTALSLIYILVFLIACTPVNTNESGVDIVAPQVPAGHIFVQTGFKTGLSQTGISKQIWRIKIDDAPPELLFEVQHFSDKPLDETFSAQELAVFEDWYSFKKEGAYPQAGEIYPVIDVSQITLSPNAQQLAWIELVAWGPPNSTTIFAMIRLIVLDLSDGKKKILHEIALHPDGRTGGESGLDGLAWSPDGQRIVFVEGWQGAYQAKIVGITTGVIKHLGAPDEGGSHSAWAPDGMSIVMESPDGLSILSAVDGSRQKLTDAWGIIDGIDWSPDGKIITFAGGKDRTPEKLQLYVLNIETKELIGLSLKDDLSYESPQWSPDGKLIAMNARSTRTSEVDKLLIYDIATQKITATLEGKRASRNFYWSTDGQVILLTMGFPPDTPRTVELFYWQENKIEIIPFPKNVEAGIAVGISSE